LVLFVKRQGHCLVQETIVLDQGVDHFLLHVLAAFLVVLDGRREGGREGRERGEGE